MTDTWAAKVLAGVPRLPINDDADNGYCLPEADALAAIARMGAGDDMVERLLENDREIFLPLLGEAAAHIAALTAQNREMALDVLASSGQAQEAYAAQLAAEAERDALRAKVARLEGVLRHYRETLCEGFCGEDMWADEGHSHPEIQRDCGGCLAASVLLSAALTDGGKDG